MLKKIYYEVFTNPGDRMPNEDSAEVCVNGEDFCFVLCDGLGGHGMGEIASQLVTSVFKSLFENKGWSREFFPETFRAAQDILMTEQSARKAEKKMKTTAVSLVIHKRKAFIAHIGDSRCYIFKRNKLKKRTLDHSVPQMLVLSKEITEDQIRFHHERNILTRVMGTEWEGKAQYEIMKPLSFLWGDSFLLCSDGFWELIDENLMCQLLEKAKSPKEWIYSMAEIIKTNGSGINMDNYTAIAVWVR